METGSKKERNLPLIIFSSIFGALALSAVVIFRIWPDLRWVKVYLIALRWLVLPFGAMVASYAATINKAPKGKMWLLPMAFGVGISLVEWATYGSFSTVLVIVGALSSLFGFTYAKRDRIENAKAARAAKRRAEKKNGEAVPEAVPQAHNDEYNPGEDFVPDEDDTWADEVLAKEGYGEIKVDYAESDPNFSIDSPDEAVESESEVTASEGEEVEDSCDEDDESVEDLASEEDFEPEEDFVPEEDFEIEEDAEPAEAATLEEVDEIDTDNIAEFDEVTLDESEEIYSSDEREGDETSESDEESAESQDL